MSTEGGTKAILAAFAANLGIALSKLFGWAITGSASMLAEAIHSFADTGNQALLLLGGKRARREATPEHPFGYGRERYFWSFIVALVLFAGGGVFSIYEGEEKIRHPHELESVGWAIGILLVAIVLEAFSFRTAVHESRKIKGRASWPQFIRRSKQPELPVVLLEDFGALIGLGVALLALGMAVATDNPRWDGMGSLTIGILLCAIAIVLAVEMKSLLIGEAADPSEQQKITEAILGTDEVSRVIHLRTEHLGPEDLLVGAKVEFSHNLSVPQLANAIDTVEANVREVVPIARLIYVEPDIHRG
jgi:cation diffusion facilitator family transporter